jgi:hypothetical protein
VPIGYRDNAHWRDMSEYVVHFSKGEAGKTAYTSMLSILASGRLQARSRFGAARGLDALGDTQQAACFSEIPLDRLDRLVERRSKYGIGFRQEFLISAGGGRVWYLDSDGTPARYIRELVAENVRSPMNLSSPLWQLTPFIDFPGSYGGIDYRFEWEREWRVPGGLTFSPDQVAFLFIPGELQAQARIFFDDAEKTRTGPNYECPFIDPLWSDNAIQAAVAHL